MYRLRTDVHTVVQVVGIRIDCEQSCILLYRLQTDGLTVIDSDRTSLLLHGFQTDLASVTFE